MNQIERAVSVVMVVFAAGAVLFEPGRTASEAAYPALQAQAQRLNPFEKVKVILTCDKARVSMGDDLCMDVAIRNDGNQDVYLFQSLHWAQGGGLGPYIRDEKGKLVYFEIDPPWPPPPPDDPTLLLCLEEGHFYGLREVRHIKDLVPGPGRYTIFVVFHPVGGRFLLPDKLRNLPVVTMDDEPINSNKVAFEVVP
jgi:hypothetical protein